MTMTATKVDGKDDIQDGCAANVSQTELHRQGDVDNDRAFNVVAAAALRRRRP